VYYDLEYPTCAIVLVGKFNPAIFSPAWLAKSGIISDIESEKSEIQIIHPEIAQFDVGKFRVEVQQTRFQITTTIAPFITIMDYTRQIFGQKLPHTPIDALGLNFHAHFDLESAEQRMLLGRRLAPVAPWGAFGERIEASQSADTAGGLLSLVMQETRPDGRKAGWRQVRIEPSRKTDKTRGVFLAVNDHFDFENISAEDGANIAVDLLAEVFDTSEQEYRKVTADIMKFAASLK
jgi:hypothetical protein